LSHYIVQHITSDQTGNIVYRLGLPIISGTLTHWRKFKGELQSWLKIVIIQVTKID
jgi:hypothetical protein